MNIQWNKVTWYSKLIAVAVFLATFFVGISIGMQYQSVIDELTSVQVQGAQGQHCGGFIKNAPTCPSGYRCQLGHIPDTGGICVKN